VSKIQHANHGTPSSVGIFRARRKRGPPAIVSTSNSTAPITTRQATDHHPASDLVRRKLRGRAAERVVGGRHHLPAELAGFLYLAVVLDAWAHERRCRLSYGFRLRRTARAARHPADIACSPDTATSEDLRRYQLHLAKQQISPGSINAAIAALRFFFTVTLERPDLVRPLTTVNKPRKAPVVLSEEEVARLLEAAPSLKYKAALSVAYGAGRRVSEVANLKVSDIDSQRMTLRVEQARDSGTGT
jgi:integrase